MADGECVNAPMSGRAVVCNSPCMPAGFDTIRSSRYTVHRMVFLSISHHGIANVASQHGMHTVEGGGGGGENFCQVKIFSTCEREGAYYYVSCSVRSTVRCGVQ